MTSTTPNPQQPRKCPHLNFHCTNNVIRFEDPDGTLKFILETRTVCLDCNTPFYFLTPSGNHDLVRVAIGPAHIPYPPSQS